RDRIIAQLAGGLAPEQEATQLPREPRRPCVFAAGEIEDVRTALKRGGRGLAVISTPGGWDKEELVLAYCAAHETDYEHIFFIRGDDEIRFEEDFLTMARIIAPGLKGAAALRRAALEYLETEARYLLIVHLIRDPIPMLRFLPWHRVGGHLLFTYTR